MPLSEHEQKILEEIERRLAAEDPKFARNVSLHTPQGRATRRIRHAGLLFLAGFGVLIAGLFVPNMLVPFGLAAFGIMLASFVLGSATIKQIGSERAAKASAAKPAPPTWFSKMEDRWRKRFERGEGEPRDRGDA